jgi:hypothetical protein
VLPLQLLSVEGESSFAIEETLFSALAEFIPSSEYRLPVVLVIALFFS